MLVQAIPRSLRSFECLVASTCPGSYLLVFPHYRRIEDRPALTRPLTRIRGGYPGNVGRVRHCAINSIRSLPTQKPFSLTVIIYYAVVLNSGIIGGSDSAVLLGGWRMFWRIRKQECDLAEICTAESSERPCRDRFPGEDNVQLTRTARATTRDCLQARNRRFSPFPSTSTTSDLFLRQAEASQSPLPDSAIEAAPVAAR